MDPFVYQSPAFPFPICTKCEYACVANEVLAHLKNNHASITKFEARQVQEAVNTIPGVIKNQAELEKWEPPSPTIERIPYISPPKDDGKGCNECKYVGSDDRRISDHYKVEHGFVGGRKRGRYAGRITITEKPWREGVRYQRLFRSRAKSGFIEVERGIEVREDKDQPQEGIDQVAEFLKRIHQEDEDAFESEDKARIQNIHDKWEASPWLNRTGWPAHLDGFEPDVLRQSMRAIEDDEPVLQRKWAIFNSVLDKAYEAAIRCSPGSAELFEIERKEAHVTTTTPFNGRMEDDAWPKYKERWRILMCIWQRMESEDEDERPPYSMTTQQATLWEQFSNHVGQVVAGTDTIGRFTPERLERSCLDMVVSFLDHPFKNGDHYESVIISGLAVMGISDHGGWLTPMEYTPVYSAIIKVAKYLVLYQSILERRDEVSRLWQTMSQKSAQEQATGLFRIVRRKVRRFMTRIPEGDEADPTPMNWIINTRTYGMKIRFTTPGTETIDWRGDDIVHGKIRLSMGKISDMLHNVLAEARRTLAELTMVDDAERMREILPRIPWSRMEDNHGQKEVGYSFLSDDRNEWWVREGKDWVMNQLLSSEEKRKAWLMKGLQDSQPYKMSAVRKYDRAVEKFRGLEWVGSSCLAGMPTRTSELLGLRMFNTGNGGIRNILMYRGMVCLLVTYHKGFRKSGKMKVIHRYLPREFGELLVWYIWLVLPFWQKVQGRVKERWRRSAFLWADEVVSQEGGKEKKGNATIKGDTETKKVVADNDSEDEDDEEEKAFMEWFQERKWTSDRVRRVLQQYSAQFTGKQLNISAWRHIAIGIANRFLDKSFGSSETEDGEEDEEGGGLVDSIYDLQAGHGSHIAGLIYARLYGQGDMGTMRSRNEFQTVSMRWHAFFGFGAEDRVERSGGMGLKRGRMEFDMEREDIRRRRFERLHRADMRGQLKQMMGESAEFRGLQEAVIRTVVRGDGPIVQITPTGGGKSLTFMLPAFCTPDGMTIVVTPLVALENDMEERCRKMGIDGYVWKSRGVQRGASLVFVTPESAVTKGFRSFVERMHGQEKLDRVVVDECHTVLEWTKTFRPRIGQLGSALQEFGLQVICLTATLKRTEERLLYAQLGFEAERVRLFRERTTRRNIEYRVEIIEEEEEGVGRRSGQRWKQNRSAIKDNKDEEEEEGKVMERVCEVVKMWTEANHKEGKVIIYGGTIERVKKIAASLDCIGYWNKAGSAEDKARWMEEWRTSVGGKSGWIVATNALGLGVDVPDVRLVVHAEMPRRLRDFVQESGRGGRDGKRSKSVVVVRSSWMKEQHGIWTKRREQRDRGGDNGVSEEGAVSKQAYEWEEDVVEFVEGKECRREVLDREMDGFMGRVGCEVGEEERCDVCRERALRMETQASRRDTSWVSIQSEEEEELARAAAAVEADYERSKRSIQWAEAEQVARVMKEAEDAADFEAELDDWSGRCIV
ncbi:hypothetical protein BFJ72_g14786 [Fusarium proliferatum]|uniref:DNA 3'-5' helicase n=1 Tax=Gibberella intermedia TaxID=948311 RepID=A0A420RYC9_GIBIN|nr:hypothetical protein BFJ72_g14786 [Fusarium proliferatum]